MDQSSSPNMPRWFVEHWEEEPTMWMQGEMIWVRWLTHYSEEDAQIDLAKLTLQHGGQWRIVRVTR